jgi:TolA-binding protein
LSEESGGFLKKIGLGNGEAQWIANLVIVLFIGLLCYIGTTALEQIEENSSAIQQCAAEEDVECINEKLGKFVEKQEVQRMIDRLEEQLSRVNIQLSNRFDTLDGKITELNRYLRDLNGNK